MMRLHVLQFHEYLHTLLLGILYLLGEHQIFLGLYRCQTSVALQTVPHTGIQQLQTAEQQTGVSTLAIAVVG